MPVYLSRLFSIVFFPRGSIRGSSSSSPRISASSWSESSTSSACSPGLFPAWPWPSPGCGWPCAISSPGLPSPCPTPLRASPNLKRGISIDGIGIATLSLPLRTIMSPFVMYLRRSCLIRPLTMFLKRARSRRTSVSTRFPFYPGARRAFHDAEEIALLELVGIDAVAASGRPLLEEKNAADVRDVALAHVREVPAGIFALDAIHLADRALGGAQENGRAVRARDELELAHGRGIHFLDHERRGDGRQRPPDDRRCAPFRPAAPVGGHPR